MAPKTPKENLNLYIDRKKKQFTEPEFQSGIALKATKEQSDHLNETESKITRIVQSSKTKDSYGKRLKEYTKKAIHESSWLSDHIIPSEKDMYDKMSDATNALKITSLSDSQKTKRGKKFQKKAEQQAKMINLMQQCHWQRKEALNDLLQHGKNARIGADVVNPPLWDLLGKGATWYNDKESGTFLDNMGDDIDEVSLEMKDLAFYYEQKRTGTAPGQEKPEEEPVLKQVEDGTWMEKMFQGPSPEITSRHYKPLELIADPKAREEGYLLVISEFEKLDLSVFDYGDNDSFMKNDGDNAFIKRYATLKAFSHAPDIVKKLGKGALGEERFHKLRVKAAILSDIYRDYESRAILLQSPYYVLLAGKDFDSFKEKELTERIQKSDDDLVKLYLQAIIDRKKEGGFKMGSKANDLLKKKLKSIPEDMKKADEENDSRIREKIQSRYNQENNRQEPLTRHDKESRSNLQRITLLLDSIEFRTKHNLGIDNEEEKALIKEFEKWSLNPPENTPATLEAWIAIKRAATEKETEATRLEADEALVTSFDPMFAGKVIFTQYINSDIQRMKEEDKYRKDPRGELRREHMKKYSKQDSYKESMPEEDVDNLLNNLMTDDIYDYRDLDYSLFEEEMITWIKAYSLFTRFREQPASDTRMLLKECRIKMQDLKDLIKADPVNAAGLQDELKELEQEEIDISIRMAINERMTLKIKNKTPVLFNYHGFMLKLRQIGVAKRMLEHEPDGKYKDAMLKILQQREDKLIPQKEAYRTMFYAVVNSDFNLDDTMTGKQKFMLDTLSGYTEKINLLHKQGTEESKAEIMRIVQKARELVLSYEDQEADDRFHITETVTADILKSRQS